MTQPQKRKPTGSTITVRVEVTDREEGTFTDVEVAVSEVTERVLQADDGDRYTPVLQALEQIIREASNKTRAQVVAFETVREAREGTTAAEPAP